MKNTKTKTQPAILEDVVKNWRKMHGRTLLLKKLNAYLTASFVTNTAPKDECLYLAERILKLKSPSHENIYKILRNSFGSGFQAGSKKRIYFTNPRIEAHLQAASASLRALILFS